MVDSKENYKFGLGIKGLKAFSFYGAKLTYGAVVTAERKTASRFGSGFDPSNSSLVFFSQELSLATKLKCELIQSQPTLYML